jgi:penicillin amidase
MRHKLSGLLKPELTEGFDLGPLPRGGSGNTVNSTGSGNQRSGASFRIIADTSNWDNSVGTNNPGQSGDPTDPHYADLFEMWATGRYFPVLFSRQSVESATETVTTLQPARR